MASEHRFEAVVWEYGGEATWYFVSLPVDLADAISDEVGDQARGFGSVRVDVRIGGTRWQTSIFPSKEQGTYVLPVKKAVREAEALADGTSAAVRLTVLALEDGAT